ncbi:MAG: hypothetical protein QGF12_04320 [SAR202 cluster bacterium]|nr:hypothetical protein [SAR202 cluster bacterium]
MTKKFAVNIVIYRTQSAFNVWRFEFTDGAAIDEYRIVNSAIGDF